MKHLKQLQHKFFTILLYDAAQSGGTTDYGESVAKDGGRRLMGGCVSQAGAGPDAGAVEDGGGRP